MNTLVNKFDSLEQEIFLKNIKIREVKIIKELELFYVFLNTGIVIRQSLNNYTRLKNKSEQELNNFEIIASGTGISWSNLDEDISLKGLLLEYFFNSILPPSGGDKHAMAA